MSAQARRHRRAIFSIVTLLVAFSACSATGYTLWRLRAERITHHIENAAMSARAFENHLTQSFNIIDTSLVQAASDNLGSAGLSRLLRHAPYLRSLNTLDTAGRIDSSSDPRNKGVRLAESLFLPPAPDRIEILRVGPLLSGRDFHDGQAPGGSLPLAGFIPVIRDVRLADHSWMRAAASVNGDYFLNFYAAHADPQRGSVELLRYDGLLLLGTDEQAKPGRTDANQEVLRRLTTSEIGSFEELRPDGRTTLTAYRASRAYPFVLVVRLDKARVLEDWRQEAARSAGIVGIVLLAALTLSGLYFARFERLAREREADQARLRVAAIAFESQEGMVVTDDAYQVLQINKAFTAITGFSAAEVIGGSMNFMRSGLHDSAFYADLREQLALNGTWAGEIMNRHKDGSVHAHFLTITSVRDDEGRPTHYVGTLTDITERRRLEAERDELNRDFVSFLENTTDFIYFKDTDSRFRFCSQALARVTGHPSWRDLTGKHTLDVFPPDTGPIYHGEEIALIRDGIPLIDKTDPYYDGEGRRGWINSSKWPILDESGKVTGLFGISRDITAHMRTEIDLRIAAIAFESQQGMLITDAGNTILRVNRAFTEITGYTEADAVGQTPRLLRSGRHDRDFYASMYASLHSTGAWQGEIWNRRKNGEIYPEWMTISTVLDGEGNPSHYVASLTDITERKKLETQFMRSQRMESIGMLAGGIAHDLNNVLAPIMMSSQLLDMELTHPEQQKLTQIILSSAKRGADLVKQVLTFYRADQSKHQEISPQHLVQDLRHIIGETFPKSVRVEVNAAAELWPVAGDATQLHQVLLNLCVNARDAMPEGGQLTVTAENVVATNPQPGAAGGAKPGAHVLISVRDTGSGIPPEIREKIFDPFFTTKAPGKGTGLGLSTSLAIIKNHGGFVNVQSEPGQGATFRVYLPALQNAAAAVAQAEQVQLPRGNGELVLVVDDEASVRLIMAQTLQTFGYRTVTANDGAEAITIYEQRAREIAVVLVDLMMPVMDGVTTIRKLAAVNPQLQVIAASGLETDSSLVAPGGCVKAFLAKPYTAGTLLKVLHETLSAGGESGTDRQTGPAETKMDRGAN